MKIFCILNLRMILAPLLGFILPAAPAHAVLSGMFFYDKAEDGQSASRQMRSLLKAHQRMQESFFFQTFHAF